MATDMKPFTSSDGRWHAWQGVAHLLLSDERHKSLTYHKTVDDMINFLWHSAHPGAARELNQHIKDSK